MKSAPLLFMLMLLVAACQGPEPRKPVQKKSSSFFKASVERSKKILAAEEKKIQQIIEEDSLKHYIESNFGAWYHYLKVNDTASYTPKKGDRVLINYNLLTLDNDTLYTTEEIGDLHFGVDQEALFLGLREAVKVLKEGERATFLFPSSIAYGYDGDRDRIGTNVPLKSTLTLLKIDKQMNNPNTLEQ
ncbi:gliding motility-associated peptidyl-prolyl isomerase GldI [Maribacter sp. 2307ULW6-5]|uniref:gliding motility-associated peptidyl-prolyl isomerase GldI n=1 Tax=Maribacter sp. 2307ULW6-5 TaxID=3386275 RepID=UPI0039BD4C2D